MWPHTVGSEIYNTIIVLCPTDMDSDKLHFMWFSLKKKKKNVPWHLINNLAGYGILSLRLFSLSIWKLLVYFAILNIFLIGFTIGIDQASVRTELFPYNFVHLMMGEISYRLAFGSMHLKPCFFSSAHLGNCQIP